MTQWLENVSLENILVGIPEGVLNGFFAFIILIWGYIIARMISGIVMKIFQKSLFIESAFARIGMSYDVFMVGKIIKKIIFFIILLFVLVAFFDKLGLEQINQPINAFITNALPGALNAFGLALVALVTATIAKMGIRGSLEKIDFDQKFSQDLDTDTRMTHTIANIAYWFIILFFLPSILGALGQQELLTPIMSIRDQIISFIPNIIAAWVVFIIGWIIAKILKKITIGLLSSVHLDKNIEKTWLKGFSLTQLAGTLVYAIIIIPIAIQALNQLQIDSISGPATIMLNTVLSYIPAVFSSIIILWVAYYIWKFVSKLLSDLLSGIGFDNILYILGFNNIDSKTKPSTFVWNLVLIYILLLAIIEASSKLGFLNLTEIVEKFLLFWTNVLIWVIIFGIGMYLANIAAQAIKTTSKSKFLPRMAKGAIIIFTAAMGLKQMWMGEDIINITFGLTLGSLAVATALAIGLGAKEVAGEEVREIIQKLKK